MGNRQRPTPKAPKVRDQLESANEDLALLDRRIELKTQERAEYIQGHGPELISLLAEQHKETGNKIAQLAGELLQELLLLYKTEDDGRALERQTAPPPEVNTGDPASVTTMIGTLTTHNMGGPRRGDIEGVLRLLQTYGEAAVVGEATSTEGDGEEQGAAVIHEPEPDERSRNGAGA
jgi:hypothetical protein